MKLVFICILAFCCAAPIDQHGKLAFSLAQPEEDVVKTEKKSGFWGVLQDISQNTCVRDFLSFMKIVGNSVDEKAPVPAARAAPTRSQQPIPLPNSEAEAFAHSLSMDDSVRRVVHDVPSKNAISQEDWARTLFGERGVLTGVFQMMDQQRKSHAQSDPTAKINGKPLDFDLKKMFDQILAGPGGKGELGDASGPELPEFLGICNRLSCGDIYKAIDKFRRSEFFSNFQTALQLVQDPNGWETIGKLLSNPELIASFTGGENSGMSELFGSALEGAKKESSKTKDKNSKIMPEDGDFGTDFTDMEEGKESKGEEKPKIDFSVDGKMTDYYEEVSKGTDISPDHEDSMEETVIDEAPPPTKPTVPMIKPTTKPTANGLPELSFSEDGDSVEGQTFETSIDQLPTRENSSNARVKSTGFSGKSPFFISTTRRITSTTTIPRTIPPRPIATTIKFTTTTRKTTTTTTKNHRKDSDYYAMYYDDPK